MSANGDTDPTSEPVGPGRPSDELEHWLTDLRTEVSADPSGWIDKDSGGEPAGVEEAAEPSTGGRHRAAD
ncbi:hypothetical protein [Actinoplanes friuliensis]|jgi:hypothetical protein|uniref:Uncharacterized protein n=1 Tax=Actinoplanes friuliensis DSM 7358 TaxID=1246995 RepID=U5VZ59_9ACTN|nr:hypothetical protein [Actinoplanes friuliensis]AGZ41015.1 hypothetical protein AFR_13645 [Actinoplanes friuliensis DSM 7358]